MESRSTSEKQLKEVEYLLGQSMNGIHHLFDHDRIAEILSKPTEEMDFFNFENIEKIQDLLNDFISKDSIIARQRFLSNLDQDSYEILVRTYFHIVENSLVAIQTPSH